MAVPLRLLSAGRALFFRGRPAPVPAPPSRGRGPGLLPLQVRTPGPVGAILFGCRYEVRRPPAAAIFSVVTVPLAVRVQQALALEGRAEALLPAAFAHTRRETLAGQSAGQSCCLRRTLLHIHLPEFPLHGLAESPGLHAHHRSVATLSRRGFPLVLPEPPPPRPSRPQCRIVPGGGSCCPPLAFVPLDGDPARLRGPRAGPALMEEGPRVVPDGQPANGGRLAPKGRGPGGLRGRPRDTGEGPLQLGALALPPGRLPAAGLPVAVRLLLGDRL